MVFETQASLLNWAWNNGYLFCDMGITWDIKETDGKYEFFVIEVNNDKI